MKVKYTVFIFTVICFCRQKGPGQVSWQGKSNKNISHFKINYLQVKAIEKLKEVRDSSEVQTLMRQQEPV